MKQGVGFTKTADRTCDLSIALVTEHLCYRLTNLFQQGISMYRRDTDVEARKLMLEIWKDNKSLELAEVDIIDIREKDDVESSWNEFFFSHHYGICKDIFQSYLFHQPRRSCDAFASATLMLRPWYSNPFPRFEILEELQEWVLPLIQEEEEFDNNKTPFTGNFLPPNKGDT